VASTDGTEGQDWASFQDDAPSTGGLGFVFVKATEGLGYVNPKHAAQVAHARAEGLVVGHYHYPHMANSPAAECDYFLQHAAVQPGDLLCLDWEGYDAANKGITVTRRIAYKAAFLARLAAVEPALQGGTYCNTDYLNSDPKGPYGDFLWIATAGKPAGQPGISHNWLFHQYSSSGGLDRDYTPLTAAQLKTWAHSKENDDMAITDADAQKIAKAILAYDGVPAARPPHANADYSTNPTWTVGYTLQTAVEAARSACDPAPVTLTAEQLAALATQVAASPGLATAIATAVLDLEAKRLQS
jgi:hypothetical protein